MCSGPCARTPHASATGEQVPPEERKPSPGLWGRAPQPEGRLRRADWAPESAPRHQSRDRCPLCGGRLVRESQKRARAEGHDSTLRGRRRPPDDLHGGVRNPRAWPSTRRRATSGPSYRSGMASAMVCPPTTCPGAGRRLLRRPYAYIGRIRSRVSAQLAPVRQGDAHARPPVPKRIPRRLTSCSTMPRSFPPRCKAAPS